MIATAEGSPRDRLLAAASELFYERGVHTVGIDTIIERAGVAKASLYNSFGSKDGVVRAYLEARHEARRARLTAEIERHDDPKERLLAVFDVLATTVAQPTFRGCAFANAVAESELDSAAADVTRDVRRWLLDTMVELTTALGVDEPPGWRDSSPCSTTARSRSRGSTKPRRPPRQPRPQQRTRGRGTARWSARSRRRDRGRADHGDGIPRSVAEREVRFDRVIALLREDQEMTQLPDVVVRYQEAHDRDDVDAALATFADDARVEDDGHEYVGLVEIRDSAPPWIDPGQLDGLRPDVDERRSRRGPHLAGGEPPRGELPRRRRRPPLPLRRGGRSNRGARNRPVIRTLIVGSPEIDRQVCWF